MGGSPKVKDYLLNWDTPCYSTRASTLGQLCALQLVEAREQELRKEKHEREKARDLIAANPWPVRSSSPHTFAIGQSGQLLGCFWDM